MLIIKKIKYSTNSVWEAIKYLRGYDTIENTNIEENEITSESFTNSPWLSLNYFDPVVDINEEIIAIENPLNIIKAIIEIITTIK